MFEIVTNLPIPPAPIAKSRSPKYPFGDLAVGEAFVIPAELAPKKGVISLRATANLFRTQNNAKTHKFVIRLLDDGSGDIGVWRTE